MTARLAFVVGFVLVNLTAGGCLPIPHTHLKRPAVAFAVHDYHGHAVSGARLAMYSGIVVGQSIRESTPIQLDSLGQGRIEREREWHWFMLFVPDAEAPWVWAWCVDAPGHRRVAAGLAHEPDDTVRIRLTEDVKGQRCIAEPHSLYDVDREGQR